MMVSVMSLILLESLGWILLPVCYCLVQRLPCLKSRMEKEYEVATRDAGARGEDIAPRVVTDIYA